MTSDNFESGGLMGPAQVAKYLGIAERTVYLWAQQGKLPALKVGSVWRFRRSEVDRWLEGSRSGPSLDPVAPLTPEREPTRSKWRLRNDEEQAEKALVNACRAYIETTLDTAGRDIFFVGQFEDRFGDDVVDAVIKALKKEKKITEDTHEGLNGEMVRVIMGRRK